MNRFYPVYPGEYPALLVEEIAKSQRVSQMTARALIRRGVRSPGEARDFLRPNIQQLGDPELLPDMDAACQRILAAVAAGEKICVYGDYDADGICATAILLLALRKLSADGAFYIPSRHTEGYGLHENSIRTLQRAGVGLIVTVDNGISAISEIALARSLGMDVVVTDHHSAGEILPECRAVVCATRRDANCPIRNLCGAGVALQVYRALLPLDDPWEAFALAAVATVADVVPLTNENRAVIAMGLPYVRAIPGFAALLDAAGWREGQPLDEQTLAFLLAPRLNASGRISEAGKAVTMLTTGNAAVARQIAGQLNGENSLRKTIEQGILREAVPLLDSSRRGVIAKSAGWNPGVIGIVSARISEGLHRPVMLFSERDGILTGSGRSPAGVDLYRVLTQCAHLFLRYGGHARAAGVTMAAENYEAFGDAFEEALSSYGESCFQPSFGYEEAIALSDLALPAVEELRLLAPFGTDNPEPAFLLSHAQILSPKTMGKDNSHLSASVSGDGITMRMVAFRQGRMLDAFSQGGEWALVAKPAINSFRGRQSVELRYVAANPLSQGAGKMGREGLKEAFPAKN